MSGISIPDSLAFLFFVLVWASYHLLLERGYRGRRGLSSLMNEQRGRWMEEMSGREVRLVDSAIMASLQNGTAFFASSSLIAIGGAATLLRATDEVLKITFDLPFSLVIGRGMWELKVLGLCVILGYAFFKFAWAYRLFNYAAILIGATPPRAADEVLRRLAARRAARMNIEAGRHFNRGQRALFYSFAYLGWFIGPYVLMVTTALIFCIIFRRQFYSKAREAVAPDSDLEI
jgi:uncharacterized membrane protein